MKKLVLGLMAVALLSTAVKADECRDEKKVCMQTVKTVINAAKSQVGFFDFGAKAQIHKAKRAAKGVCKIAYKACKSTGDFGF